LTIWKLTIWKLTIWKVTKSSLKAWSKEVRSRKPKLA
jgi:hypothetical protein